MWNGRLTVNITERGACQSLMGLKNSVYLSLLTTHVSVGQLSVGRVVTKVDVLEYSTNR